MSKHRPRHTDEFRANAVLMLEAARLTNPDGALSRVAAHLGLHHQTLARWADGKQNPPPRELVQEKKRDFISQLQAIKGLAADKIIERIEDFEPRDLTGLLKISAELSELLSGEPTQRIEKVETWLNDLPSDEYESVIAEAERIIRENSGGGIDPRGG
jgi:transposase-like protein